MYSTRYRSCSSVVVPYCLGLLVSVCKCSGWRTLPGVSCFLSGTSPVVLPDFCRYHRIKRTGFQCNGTDSCKRRHVGLFADSFVLLHVAVVLSLVGGGVCVCVRHRWWLIVILLSFKSYMLDIPNIELYECQVLDCQGFFSLYYIVGNHSTMKSNVRVLGTELHFFWEL